MMPIMMCEISERNRAEAAAKAAEEATIRTKVEGIKNLMDSLKLTAQQAMAALKIPESDYPKYIAML